MQETHEVQVLFLGREDAPGAGNGNPLQYCLENLALLALGCCTSFFLVAVSGGYSSSRCADFSFSCCSSGPLEHRLSSCGVSLIRGMWDLPGPGIEPVSPAWAGGFFTAEPLGMPQLWELGCIWLFPHSGAGRGRFRTGVLQWGSAIAVSVIQGAGSLWGTQASGFSAVERWGQT